MMIWGWLYFPLTCMTQPAILNPWSKQTCNQRLQTKEKIWHSVDNWLMKRRMKSHLHEPAKSGGVVVPDGLRIAKRLEDRVCLKDLLLHPRWDVCRHAGGCSFGDGSNLVPPSILSIVWPFQDKKTLVTFATYQMGPAIYIDKKNVWQDSSPWAGLNSSGITLAQCCCGLSTTCWGSGSVFRVTPAMCCALNTVLRGSGTVCTRNWVCSPATAELAGSRLSPRIPTILP